VKRDRARINAALALQKEMGQHRADERKALANLNKAKALMAQDEMRVKRDRKRESQQASRAQMLLRKAEASANQARSALASAHKLRLSSETEVETSGGSQEAASDFEQAKGQEGMSRKATSQALDYRSKSRLAQELAAVLRTMVAKDRAREERDKAQLKEKQRDEDQALSVEHHDQREERRHPLHKLEEKLRVDMLTRSRYRFVSPKERHTYMCANACVVVCSLIMSSKCTTSHLARNTHGCSCSGNQRR
jgi:hypothetical protein